MKTTILFRGQYGGDLTREVPDLPVIPVGTQFVFDGVQYNQEGDTRDYVDGISYEVALKFLDHEDVEQVVYCR